MDFFIRGFPIFSFFSSFSDCCPFLSCCPMQILLPLSIIVDFPLCVFLYIFLSSIYTIDCVKGKKLRIRSFLTAFFFSPLTLSHKCFYDPEEFFFIRLCQSGNRFFIFFHPDPVAICDCITQNCIS